jgi:hypothetical protein
MNTLEEIQQLAKDYDNLDHGEACCALRMIYEKVTEELRKNDNSNLPASS